MSITPIVAKPNAVALCLGVVAMVLFFLLGSLALNLAIPHWSLEAGVLPVVSLLFPLTVYFASGFVVGYTAKRAPLMHGVLLGLLVMGLFAGVTFVVAGGSSWVAFLQLGVGAMVICSLGTIVGDSLARR